MRATPERMIGFTPGFRDATFHTVDSFGEVEATPEDIRALGRDADRVVALRAAGLGEERVLFVVTIVAVYRR